MPVEIKIDPSYTEPKIIVLTSSMTEDVSNLVKKLSENVPDFISGSRNEKMEVLEQADLIRVYANAGKVFAVTPKGEYLLRLRLYELEERLNPDRFDLSITGTICVQLSNGTVTYVSRRYVSKLKKILGI